MVEARPLNGRRFQFMRRCHLTLILILFSALAVPSARAASFIINFQLTVGTLAPTSGAFDYDPASGFSNFVVNWDGEPFNLTAVANSPQGSGCGTYNAALTFAFLEGMTPCASQGESASTDFWQANFSAIVGTGTFEFSDGIANSLNFFTSVSDPSNNVNVPTTQGKWTVTEAAAPAPEPYSAILALAGVALLTLRKHMIRCVRTAKPTTESHS
jgi:hypothetical protein